MKLKVVCLNIWHGAMLSEAMAFLRSQNADIVMLQEVFNATDDTLAERYRAFSVLTRQLDYAYQHFAPAAMHRTDVGNIDNGNAIFSRLPIRSADVRFIDSSYGERDPEDPKEWAVWPRNLQHAEIDAGDVTLHVFNFQGVWDLDGDNYSPQRQSMSQTIIEAVAGKDFVILAGDTNAKPTNQAMRDIEAHLTPVFGNELKSTFNMRQKTNPGYATAAVDLMYVSATIEVLSKSCPDVDVSDHRPLVVELQLDPRTQPANNQTGGIL